jgi:hypothetical protein
MRTLLCLFGLAALVAVAVSCVLECGSGWGAKPWEDLVCFVDLLRVTEREQARDADLTRRAQVVLERFRRKKALIVDLIVGRKTLLRVAAQFRHFQETSGDPDPVPTCFPGTKAEWYCREVIAWVGTEMEDSPAAQRAVVERLKLELQFYLNQPGGLQLPAANCSAPH